MDVMKKLLPISMLVLLFAAISGAASEIKSEDNYNSASQELLAAYSQEISLQQAQLVVENHWNGNTLNGFAERSGSLWKIETYGGLYRSPVITPDGYMALLCHELGHHIGGGPYKPDISWMSSEGQADYFASSVCLKRIWKDKDNRIKVNSLNVPKSLLQICQQNTTYENTLALCLRVGMAAYSFVEFNRIEHGYASEDTPVQFDNSAKYIADRYFIYPRAQCRLDTFVAGMTGASRPLCWYIP